MISAMWNVECGMRNSGPKFVCPFRILHSAFRIQGGGSL